MSSENLHVPRERLSKTTRLMHYAITSLMEELEAVDWYRQRADDAEDDELKQVLLHNMKEEMEHACMLIEWLRRNNDDFAGHIETYLYSEGSLLAVEAADEQGGGGEKGGGNGGGGSGRGSRKPRFTIGRLSES